MNGSPRELRCGLGELESRCSREIDVPVLPELHLQLPHSDQAVRQSVGERGGLQTRIPFGDPTVCNRTNRPLRHIPWLQYDERRLDVLCLFYSREDLAFHLLPRDRVIWKGIVFGDSASEFLPS